MCSCVSKDQPSLVEIKGGISLIPQNWREKAPIIILDSGTDLRFDIHAGGNKLIRTDTNWYYINKKNPALLLENYIYSQYFFDEKIDITDETKITRNIVIKIGYLSPDEIEGIIPDIQKLNRTSEAYVTARKGAD